MGELFVELKKLSREPLGVLLSREKIRIESLPGLSMEAPVTAALEPLYKDKRWLDLFRIFSIALPAREAIWWSCLAARDMAGKEKSFPCLIAAEAWVFKPTDESWKAAAAAAATAAPDDEASGCAMAVQYHAGTMGPGEFATHPAPPALFTSLIFMVITMAFAGKETDPVYARHLIDRAVDIARGGNGYVALLTQAGS